MRHFNAPLIINHPISPSWMLLGFSWPEDLPAPLPGQFFTFRPPTMAQGEGGLLRRPLAFAGFEDGTAYSLYQVRGPATRALASHVRMQGRPGAADGSGSVRASTECVQARRDSRAGNSDIAPAVADVPAGIAEIDILGPLGNAFPLPESDESAYLAGGGVGCGPILYLYSYICKLLTTAEHQGTAERPACVLGFRTSTDIPAMDAFEKNIHIATDDGSAGLKGNAVEAIAELMASPCRRRVTSEAGAAHIYACGPAPMLRAAEALAAQTGSRFHVSAEQWMACGVGACQGCAIPLVRGGYARVCADGPVFDGGQIAWERL